MTKGVRSERAPNEEMEERRPGPLHRQITMCERVEFLFIGMEPVLIIPLVNLEASKCRHTPRFGCKGSRIFFEVRTRRVLQLVITT